jgi:8-oxo-dGTP pyrophosphatase MutT (NUDIX family)
MTTGMQGLKGRARWILQLEVVDKGQTSGYFKLLQRKEFLMARKNGPWTIKETTQKYKNAFMEVNEDQVTQPDGQPGSYATVTMPPGVAVLAVDQGRFVYLTRQFRYAVGRESLEAASGTVQQAEEPQEAARRELREELGIEAEEWIPLGQLDMDTSIIHCPMHLFLAKDLRFGHPEHEGTEVMEPIKIPFDEAVQKVMDSIITAGSTCILILKARQSGQV